MLANVRNVIFDFGGVIMDLSTQKTIESLADLGGLSLASTQSLIQSDVFLDYERGKIADQQFREFIRTQINIALSDGEIDKAWNAMLLDIPQSRLDLLGRLKEKYNLFLLSNTNAIHYRFFSAKVIAQTGSRALEFFFHKTYYSHLLGMRKPDEKIFEHVITDNNLNPSDTLFLDDNPENLAGAARTGLQTFHVSNPDIIFSLFA